MEWAPLVDLGMLGAQEQPKTYLGVYHSALGAQV